MKLFVVFIFCFLAPLVVNAGNVPNIPNQPYNCACVDILFCNDQFTSMVRPRSLRQECNVGNQVCCRPEHITQFPNLNLNTPSDYNPNTEQCGIRTPITNAYGGRLVQPNYLVGLGEIPWQVAILRNSSVGSFFIGSGALVNQYAIITSAHILNSLYPDQIIARLGENNFQADPARKYPALNARIGKIIIDEDFNRNTLENDVAVLCLNSPVQFSSTINPVCLPEPGDFIGDSARCVQSGWGKNSFNGNYSTILRKNYQNLVPLDICSDILRNRVQDPSYSLAGSFVCGRGKSGRDGTCTGDAGNPLTCTNKNGQEVLVGVSSWGIGCAEPGIPGVYANVRYPTVYEWIKQSIQQCIPQTPPSPPSSSYNNYPSSSNYNNDDYTVVNYNSNNYNYNSNQNYNGQSNYNSNNQNYNSQSNYNQMNNQNYNGQSDYNSNNQNYNGQSDYNSNNQNYLSSLDYNNQDYIPVDYSQLNENYNSNNNNNYYPNPSTDYYSNSYEMMGRDLNSPMETAKSAVENSEPVAQE